MKKSVLITAALVLSMILSLRFICAAGGSPDYQIASRLVGSTAGGDLTGTYPDPSVRDGAITNSMLASNCVTSAKILDGTIVAADLASNSITTVKITDANVTDAKLASTFLKADGSVDGTDQRFTTAVRVAKALYRTGTTVSVTSNYILTAPIYSVYHADNSSTGDYTVTLPSASTYTDVIITIIKEASADTLSITHGVVGTMATGSDITLTTQYDSVTVQSSGTKWYVIK